MKKFQILVLAIVAVCALSATLVASASAETTLLALWLSNGSTFAGNLASTLTGEILLEDTVFKIAILCSGILDGTVSGANGEDEITKVLNLSGVEIGAPLVGLSLICELEAGCAENADIEVWAVHLPWTTLLELVVLTGGTEDFYDLILKGTGGNAGYEELCLILGAIATQECVLTEGTGGEVENAAGGVKAKENVALEPNANCTTGGTGAGVNVPETNLLTVGGATLSV